MHMFVIRWQIGSKVWESERYARSAKEALASFRKAAKARRINAVVLGILNVDGGLSLHLI
jgi:hypothetical protein